MEDEAPPEEEQEPANTEENIDGGEMMTVRATVSSSNGPHRAKGTQETGRLRVLYYTMDPDYTTQTTTMGELCGVPAHSIIMADGKTQKAAYCLNQERGATEGYSYTWKDAEESGQSDVIGTICALGYQYTGQPTGSPPTPWGKGESNDRWLCTQLLIWAACNGYVKLGSDHLISIDPAVDADMAKVTPRAYNPTGFSSYYATLKAKLLNFRKIPSFASYPAEKGFRDSFGFPTDPFPTLLASNVNPFAFYYEDDPESGCVRFLTELESERLMGLPEGWTKYGANGQEISRAQRYKALGNAVALPCADYIMEGIAEAIG